MESSIEIAKEYWNIKSSLAAQKSEFSFLRFISIYRLKTSTVIANINYVYAVLDRETRHQHGRGPCNIFILDTSSSLREQGSAQMKNAFTSIIDGLFFPESP